MHKDRNASRHKCSSTASSARPDFTSQLAREEIDAISGGAGSLCVLHTSAIVNQGHSAAVEWSKITRVRRGKKQEGGNIFAATHSSNRLQELESVSPAALLSNFCQLCAHRSALKEKVEFSARRVGTNGLNSLQLSLDKLKTNTCSPSKHPVTRSVSFFPKDKQRQ